MQRQAICVVGGTYIESCALPYWYETYGSGGRAVSALLSLGCHVDFHTYLNNETQAVINARSIAYKNKLNINAKFIEHSVAFDYLYPLGHPTVSGILNNLEPITINDTTTNFLIFGMLEANAIIHGNRVVYDPQHPDAPQLFTENGSTAEQLAIVLNSFEAQRLLPTDTSAQGIDALGYNLLQHAEVVIIKLGAEGVAIFDKSLDEPHYIPCYHTATVWKIGTGDVFSASFAYAWLIKELNAVQAAQFAAKATAYYAQTQGFASESLVNNLSYPTVSLQLPKTIYLAGPFFNLSQLWLINECRRNLYEFGFSVFSPYHDIGMGSAEQVVSKDLAAIERCDLLFALLDDMDPGTLFEIGYAKAKGKIVIIYTSQTNDEALKMMRGSQCLIFDDLTTAIYHACWKTN